MFQLGAFFTKHKADLPCMAHANDVRLHPESVIGVYIKNLDGNPKRRLIRFSTLTRAISNRIALYNDPDLVPTARKAAWAELEALRTIRRNVVDYTHQALTLSSDPAFARSLVPHVQSIIKSADHDFRLLGISLDDPRKIDAFKALVLKNQPRTVQFAHAAKLAKRPVYNR